MCLLCILTVLRRHFLAELPVLCCACCCLYCLLGRKVLRATVSSPGYEAFIKNQSKAADKAAATKIKGLINDTSSTLFDDVKWAVNWLARFQSAIREVRYQPLMKIATDFCQLA
jgi:hypothetical protein